MLNHEKNCKQFLLQLQYFLFSPWDDGIATGITLAVQTEYHQSLHLNYYNTNRCTTSTAVFIYVFNLFSFTSNN